jgi:predicted nucleotidyltransferase component of viral defense system
MTVSKVAPIRFHEDSAYFREAVDFTAAATGFPSRLIEKDYFCTLLLQHMAAIDAELVFKGDTCLAKVHADFYRLSEDIDFAIPTPVDASRTQRSRRARDLKAAVRRIDRELAGLRVTSPMTEANNSTQYIAVLGYSSLLGPKEETIKIKVGLREPLLTPSLQAEVRTLLLDPVNELPLVPLLSVECLSWEEAMAEKFRAALSRREVAVRDFYDIDHAVHRLGFRVLGPEFVELVRTKLAIPGNESIDVSAGRLNNLRLQVDAELRPVLRTQDFEEFNLERAFAKVVEVAAALEP